ncbi:MAG: hypothetical protein NXI31_04350 [bacterium]|nr:hypothetical protein [bacterium]
MRATCPVIAFLLPVLFCLPAMAQAAKDRDRDRVSDFHEVHKYRTDPTKADTDGDGVPDGEWRERREYQYTVRVVVQVMRPVTPDYLNDDYQDVRVLDETADHVELEVVLYPFNTVAEAIGEDAKWQKAARKLGEWTRSGPAANWNSKMRRELWTALVADGIVPGKLSDKQLVERASKWLCQRAKYNDSFTTFVTAFDKRGRPFIPSDLEAVVAKSPEELERQWQRDILARGMFEQKVRGSCSSSATYLNGCLRALGIPTRIVLCVPIVDSNDPTELKMLRRGLKHRALRRDTVAAIEKIKDSWASHTFNEVFVDGRWRRLNYDRLGQDIRDPGMFGLMIHVATFSDWSEANMPATIGKRQTLRRYDDVFGYANPYSTIALRDEFGVHSEVKPDAPILTEMEVTDAVFCDSPDAPDFVREWAAKKGHFGLAARVEGASNNQDLGRFMDASDQRVFLVADGHPTLGVGFEKLVRWYRPEGHAYVFVPFGGADRRDLVTGVPYRFVTRNQGEEAHWQVRDDLRVIRKP